MKPLFRFFLPLLMIPALGCAEPLSEATIQANLAKIPASDPAPAGVPPLVEAIKGQHPRLLFTAGEIAALKARIPSDPILKKAYEDNTAWAKKFTLAKAYNPKAILGDDTAALTMFKAWPALAYSYALDRDPGVKQAIVDILQMMLAEPHWANTPELDSNMGAGNNMLMVGLLFDAVYNDLDPDLRAKLAAKMLVHVRRMYYLGHRQLCLMPVKYWQQDPFNNHRWHRAAGSLACLLSIADLPGLETGYLLQEFKKEMDLLIQWFPEEGDCHEGAAYQVFGFSYLAMAAEMSDRVLGTRYLDRPGFKNAWAQQLYYSAPGRQSNISFGDDMNGPMPFDNQETAFFLCPKLTRDANVQAALVRRFAQRARFPNNPERAYAYPWGFLAFYDPSLSGGDYRAVPTNRLFPDLGAASLRDNWEDGAFCFTFKCGPYGGYKLNQYAHAFKDEKGQPHYVNVAHDDPAANEFALGSAGEFLFHPGFYSLHKITENHSTLTIDGKGQVNEGEDFTQPVVGADMRKLSYLTGWKAGEKGRVIIEGEAANAYQTLRKEYESTAQAERSRLPLDQAWQPVLKRFRRAAVWMPGEYILILDDVVADGPHRITWRGTVEKGQFENPAEGRCYVATQGGKRLDFQMLANREFNGAINHAYLDGRFGGALMQQFEFYLDANAVKFACALDPWKRNLTTTLRENGDTVTVTVRSGAFEDCWTWKPATDAGSPSSIEGRRGNALLLALTGKDKAPAGEE
ncbi:MAG: hypothetical protein ACFUZC_23620 [Chthoniobacteraceae bacterium]